MRFRLWLLVIPVVCAVGLAAQPARPTVRIVGAAPLSGPDAAGNAAIQNAARLAVEEAKARYDQLGLQLEFVDADDQGSQQVGAQVAERLAADSSVLGVVGHVSSAVSVRAMQVYAQTKLLMVSAASTSPAVTDAGLENVNRVCGRDDVQGPVAARFLRDTLSLRRVFVVNDGTQYGLGLAEAFRDQAGTIGLSVVGFVTNPGADGNPLEPAYLLSLSLQIKLYQPQAVFYSGTDSQGGPLVKALREVGFSGAILAADGIDTQNFVTLAGPSAAGVYFSSTAGSLALFENASAFTKHYLARFKTMPEPYAPYGYDAASVVLEAIEAAYRANGNRLPSRAMVSRAARDVELSGVSGRIAFTDRGDRRVADYFIKQFKTATYPGVVIRKLSSAPPKR